MGPRHFFRGLSLAALLCACSAGEALPPPPPPAPPELDLVALSVEPREVRLVVGASVALRVVGQLRGAGEIDLTGFGTSYLSESNALASVTDGGVVRAERVGITWIDVTHRALTARVPIAIGARAEDIVGLRVRPERIDLELRASAPYAVIGLRADGGEDDLTLVASVSVPPRTRVRAEAGLVTAGSTVATTLLVAIVGEHHGSAEIHVRPPDTLAVGLEVAPDPLIVTAGGRAQLQVRVRHGYSAAYDVSAGSAGTRYEVAEGEALLSVSADGIVSGIGEGSGRIEISHAAFSASVRVDVTAASPLVAIRAVPSPLAVPLAGTAQLTVIGTLEDGSEVELSSAALGTSYQLRPYYVGDISVNGLVLGRTLGSGQVHVWNAGRYALAEIEVSEPVDNLLLIPPSLAVRVGGSTRLHLTSVRDDGSEVEISGLPGVRYEVEGPFSYTQNSDGSLEVAASATGFGSVTASLYGELAQAALHAIEPDHYESLFFGATSVLEAGGVGSFRAIGFVGFGARDELTDDPGLRVTADPSLLVFLPGGVLEALAPGTATITAEYRGHHVEQRIVITPTSEAYRALRFEPDQVSLPLGGVGDIRLIAETETGRQVNVSHDPRVGINGRFMGSPNFSSRADRVSFERYHPCGPSYELSFDRALRATLAIDCRLRRAGLRAIELRAPATLSLAAGEVPLELVASFDETPPEIVTELAYPIAADREGVVDVREGRLIPVALGSVWIQARYEGLVDQVVVEVVP